MSEVTDRRPERGRTEGEVEGQPALGEADTLLPGDVDTLLPGDVDTLFPGDVDTLLPGDVDTFAGLGDAWKTQLAKTEAWLSEHHVP